MASLWGVSAPEGGPARVMKILLIRYGEDPAAIVSFAVEQVIMPRLTGVSGPRLGAISERAWPGRGGGAVHGHGGANRAPGFAASGGWARSRADANPVWTFLIELRMQG